MGAAASIKKLSTRVMVVVATTVLVAAVCYAAIEQMDRSTQVERSVLAQARSLNIEMQAVWDYIDAQQDAINYNSDGTYDFKGVYCSVAGKSIARRFTGNAEGYAIRYVRENPRTGSDAPDEFEQKALDHFSAHPESTEYYGAFNMDGRPVFRYASVLAAKRNCLECHGSPQGEKDITGFLKEGMEMGDIAGAVSMVIPLDAYEGEARESLVRSLGFFVLLALAVALVIAFMLKRWVAAPLESANRRLVSENQLKSDYLAMMSHELRTPLSSIIAYADILDKREEGLSELGKDCVHEIKGGGSVLLNMVTNTIDVARMEAGRFALQMDEVDIDDVCEAAFSQVQPLAKKAGIELGKEVDSSIPVIRSDWDALRKILVNLLGNAVKFTAAGGRVDLLVVRDGDVMAMTVADTGKGIAPEDAARIFDRFEQSAAPGSQEEGSGIGLYLVRMLAEELGGTVEVRSEVGAGSEFTVRIPMDLVPGGEGCERGKDGVPTDDDDTRCR